MSVKGEDLQHVCQKRNIKSLIHFTNMENFSSILKRGLIPRSDLDKSESIFNDEYRQDGHSNSVSLSVQFPNYSMFYSYSNGNHSEWIVLVLDRSILWELECAFYHENAAAGTFSGSQLSRHKNVSAFKRMYGDVKYKNVPVQRSKLDIPDRYPTNPQAEVIVFSKIDPSYIKAAVCKTPRHSRRAKRSIDTNPGEVRVLCDSRPYNPRSDYEIWSTIRKAKDGDAESNWKLGNYYLKGTYMEKNSETALEHYRVAARKENPKGIAQLGFCYAEGVGVDKDFQKAIQYFQESAEQGVKAAQHNLGLCFEAGNGVEEDLQKAKMWYNRAADQGYRRAQDRLEEMEDEPEDGLPF